MDRILIGYYSFDYNTGAKEAHNEINKGYCPALISGKTVVPFCTHGGGGFGEIERRIAEECPNSIILPRLSVNGIATAEQIVKWLKKIGF